MHYIFLKLDDPVLLRFWTKNPSFLLLLCFWGHFGHLYGQTKTLNGFWGWLGHFLGATWSCYSLSLKIVQSCNCFLLWFLVYKIQFLPFYYVFWAFLYICMEQKSLWIVFGGVWVSEPISLNMWSLFLLGFLSKKNQFFVVVVILRPFWTLVQTKRSWNGFGGVCMFFLVP